MTDTLTDLTERAKVITDRHPRTREGGQPRNDAPPVTLDGTTAKVRLYQPIDSWGEFWGVSASEMLSEIDQLPSNIDTIEVAINSPGGEVFEAIAIVNALRRHEARIVVIVDGMAASAASFIAASADETVMMPNSQMMIHAAMSGIRGDANDLREMADLLDDITLNICGIYEAKSGTPASDWLDMMNGVDVWLTADRAVELGLADRVEAPAADEQPTNKIPAEPVSAQIDDDTPVIDEGSPWSLVDAELQLLAL